MEFPAGSQPTIIEKPAMPVLADPELAVERALDDAFGDPTVAALVQSARSACIVICDITRPVPNGLILPPLVATLLRLGLPAEKVTILIATGLHRPNLGDEMRELVGSDWILDTVRVENHYAQDDVAHLKIGTTTLGTKVKLDRRFVEADLKIVTGLIEPHFMAGYSGGRKVIAPGIAHADTIRTFHSTRFMEHPLARNCNFAGNPLHAEQLEIVQMLGPILAINTCLDDERRLAFVNFGEVVKSHHQAVAFMRQFAEVKLPKSFRTVITSNAGYPQDKTFYQTTKGIVGALGILQKGGTLLVASECSEGLGSPEFIEAQTLLANDGIEGFLNGARHRPLANIDEWATVKLIEALRDYDVHLFAPGLGPADQKLTCVKCHKDWAGALSAVLSNRDPSEVAVIPEGPYVIPSTMA